MSVRKRRWTTRTGEEQERWVVDYVNQDGHRHLRTFKKKKDADTYHATVRVDVAQGVHTAMSRSITVAQAAADWLAHVKAEGRERTTLDQYRQHVDIHILPKLGKVKLAALTTPRINAFSDELLASISVRTGKKMTRVMARMVLASLKQLLRDAKRRGNVAQNVAADVTVKLDSRSRRKLKVGVDIPTAEEITRIVNASHGRTRVVLVVAAFTGLRASELRGLDWKAVELDGPEPRVHVRQRADRYGVIGNPKSETSAREVPIGPYVANALKHWRALEQRYPLVFANRVGHIEHHQNLVQRMWHPAQIAAGVTVERDGKLAPKYTGLHCLRHFYASWLINRRQDGGLELPLKEVQARLGHATLAMTADRYGHLFPRTDHSAEIAAAEQALGLHVA
jgi:integrase